VDGCTDSYDVPKPACDTGRRNISSIFDQHLSKSVESHLPTSFTTLTRSLLI
jgi:hypothetical protein